MSGAEIVLAGNIAVAGLFALSFVVVALTNRAQRAALWFAVTYFIGMVSPIGDFLSGFSDLTGLMEWLSYADFLAATLGMAASVSRFHGQRPPWRLIGALFVGGVLSRIVIWNWPKDTLGYGFAYQFPLVLAALLAARSVAKVPEQTPFHKALALVFGAIAVNLALKPFAAAAYGSGATLKDYTSTNYALISQAGTGFLLLAAGIILLLVVTQAALSVSQMESETDALSGLANRRGFDRQAQDMLTRAARGGQPVSVAVFDLDHFKQINDTYGHQVGDTVIAAFGDLLRAYAPAQSILARLGGEEFAMLVEGQTSGDLRLVADGLRLATLSAARATTVSATVSGGVAQRLPIETFAELMRRADQALYKAKSEGRNRICGNAADDVLHHTQSNIVPFFRAQ